MKTSLGNILFLGLVTFFLACAPAFAATQVATVVAARGEVHALDAKGKSRPLAIQAPIFEEDIIKTGARSRVQIMFADNTLINLGNATTIKIAEYRWQPEQNDGAIKTKIEEGTFRIMGGALAKKAPQNFKTETPTATIGIRGSMYAGLVTHESLSVVFQGGTGIDVTNSFGTVAITQPGFGTKVALDAPPKPPVKFTAQELGELNKALGGDGAEEKEKKKEDKKDSGDKKTKNSTGTKKEQNSSANGQQAGAQGADNDGQPAGEQGTASENQPAEGQTAATESQPASESTAQETAASPAPATEGGVPLASTTADAGTITSGGNTTTAPPTVSTSTEAIPTAVEAVSIIPVITDLTRDVATVTSQTDTAATLAGTATNTTVTNIPPTSTPLTGNYRFIMRDIDLTLADPTDFNPTFLLWDSGTVNATLFSDGTLNASAVTDSTSTTPVPGFPTSFGPYAIPGYTPTAPSYNGFSSFTNTISVTDQNLGLLNLTATNYGDVTGQFFYSTLNSTISTSTTDAAQGILIAALIYGGVPSTSIPNSGIDTFVGDLIHNTLSPTDNDANMEQFTTEINYYNRRLIGRTFNQKATFIKADGAIFFGTVNSDATADITILGGGNPGPGPDPGPGPIGGGTPTVTATYGNSTSANLYGSFNQGLGFTASGSDYLINDNTIFSNWQATGAAFRDAATEYNNSYPTSPMTYKGFVMGVGDDTGTGNPSRIFMNNSAENFVMTVNPTTGTVNGTLNANDILLGGPSLILNIGDPIDLTQSAYILNDQMVAILSGSSSHSLSNHGNFLYTAGPDVPEITAASTEYMNWGYWELAYTDPSDSSKDNLFSQQAFFVAGQQTPVADITALASGNFTGTYTGKAFGVHIVPETSPSTNVFTERLTSAGGANPWGIVTLDIDFSPTPSPSSVHGSLAFDQGNLTIDSTTPITTGGFSANVTSVSSISGSSTPTTSAVNGTFFGPSAAGIGGNFRADMGTGEHFVGVFGASR